MPVERAGVNGSNDSLEIGFFSRMNVFVLSELVASKFFSLTKCFLRKDVASLDFGISVQALELTLRSLASLAIKYHSAEVRVIGRRLSLKMKLFGKKSEIHCPCFLHFEAILNVRSAAKIDDLRIAALQLFPL